MNEVVSKKMVSKKSLTLLVLALLISSATSVFALSEPLAVHTDKEVYHPGEFVTIYGSATASGSVGILVNVSSRTILNRTALAAENGSYALTFQLASNATLGEYSVSVSSGEESAETEFRVEAVACGIADNLLSLLEASRAQAETILDRLVDEGVEIPQAAKEKLDLGEEAAEEALRLRDEGNCSSAAAQAIEALRLYREAVQIALEVEPEEIEEDEVEEEAERAIEIRVAIERASAFLDRLNATADRLGDDYNVTQIRENLNEAQSYLDTARGFLDSGNITSAAQELATARSILDRTMRLLYSTVKEVKVMKARGFLERMRGRIQSTDKRIEQLRNCFRRGAVITARETLNSTMMKLQRIKELLEANNVTGAMEEIDDAIDEIDKSVNQLNGRGTSALLGEMSRLEAKIRVLNATAERLAKAGVDTYEMEEGLTKAGKRLSEAMAKLGEGNTDDAEALLEAAEESIDDISHGILGIEPPSEISGWRKKWSRPHPDWGKWKKFKIPGH